MSATTAVSSIPACDRDWWRAEARRCGTDMSSLLRQRIKVLAWVRAGRPPLSEWMKSRRAFEDVFHD
jgi:hypothetical protein